VGGRGAEALLDALPQALEALDVSEIGDTTKIVASLPTRFPNLTSLKVNDSVLGSEAWVALAQMSNLRTLELSGVALCESNLKDNSDAAALSGIEYQPFIDLFTQIGKLTQLRALKLRLNFIPAAAIVRLSPLISLEELQISQITDDSLTILFEALPQLRTLDLSGNEKITDLSIRLIHQLKQLERLDLYLCPQVGTWGVAGILKCFSLRELLLAADDLSSGFTPYPVYRPELRKSIGYPHPFQPEDVAALGSLSKLALLDLQGVSSVYARTLATLIEVLPGLRSLNIRDCREIRKEGFAELHKLKNLQHLSLGSDKYLYSKEEGVTKEDTFTYIIDDEICDQLLEMKTLRYLSIANASKLSAKKLLALLAMPNLEHLEVAYANDFGFGASSLKQPIALKKLTIRASDCSDELWPALENAPNLRELAFGCSSKDRSHLERLATLVGKSKLQRLDLRGGASNQDAKMVAKIRAASRTVDLVLRPDSWNMAELWKIESLADIEVANDSVLLK